MIDGIAAQPARAADVATAPPQQRLWLYRRVLLAQESSTPATRLTRTVMQQMEITMQNQFFTYRDKCPACNSGILEQLYQKPYDEPPIREYLKSFYSSQGGIEFKYLKNATFNLCECKECGLIFQKEIPNDFLMKELYEKWLDPKKVFDQHQKTDDLSLYTYYAQEISTIIAYLHQVPSELSFLDFGMGWGKWALMAKGFGCEFLRLTPLSRPQNGQNR